MKYLVFVLLIILHLSCKSTKEAALSEEEPSYTHIAYGVSNFSFKQYPTRTACDFNTKTLEELVQFIELNYAGDRDDKIPRKIKTMPDILSKKKTSELSSRLSVKICYSNEGEVVAFSHEGEGEVTELHEAMYELRYEENAEDGCVTCKTESLYISEYNWK